MDERTSRWVREAFDHWIRAGYHLDALPEEVEERARDLAPEVDEAELRALAEHVRVGLAAQRDLEAGWTEETVNDRLDEAFAELWDSGVVALQDAAWSLEDALQDGEDRLAEEPDARGFVLWQGQETERGVRGEGLRLTARAADGDHAALAAEVREVLAKHGVSADPRLRIGPFEWKKRFFTA